MTERVKIAEQLIEQLDAEELKHFATWFADFHDHAWEEQIERDALSGRLDKLIEQADRDIDAGHFHEI